MTGCHPTLLPAVADARTDGSNRTVITIASNTRNKNRSIGKYENSLPVTLQGISGELSERMQGRETGKYQDNEQMLRKNGKERRMKKAYFIKKLSELLEAAQLVEKIRYYGDGNEEYVQIETKFGGLTNICTTANSNAANLNAIASWLSSGDCIGRITSFKKNEQVNDLFYRIRETEQPENESEWVW